ncbi:MAG: TolC family protein [Nitrospiraceae bacterium]|nr:TolC family protein [Nitrospiraceae bacterium]
MCLADLRQKKETCMRMLLVLMFALLCAGTLLFIKAVTSHAEQPLLLKDLIDEALRNSPEIKAAEMRTEAAQHRVPQVSTLPDPVVSFGYQNEGFSRYTYGKEQGAQWMYSVTQAFPFPGKLSLKGETAAKDAAALREGYGNSKTKLIQRIKELYYDLALAYKNLDLLQEQSSLLKMVADIAAARYAAGRGSQQDVLAAQTEELLVLEKQEMLNQKVQVLKAGLNNAAGRDASAQLSRPVEQKHSPYALSQGEAAARALAVSPEVKTRQRLVEAAQVRVNFANKDLLPDFSVTGSYFDRRGPFLDMWSLTAAVSIPIFSETKQKQAVKEAEAMLREAQSELETAKLSISSGIHENFSVLRSAESLMNLYRNSLIPKARQDIEAARAAYTAGRSDASGMVARLKSLIELEALYWNQSTEYQKAAARIEALAGDGHNSILQKD